MPTNTHNDDIWCLGQRYDSHPEANPPESTQPDSSLPSPPPATSATESIPSDSATVPQKEDEFEIARLHPAQKTSSSLSGVGEKVENDTVMKRKIGDVVKCKRSRKIS
ncbi:hypothetical protein KCU93_g8450, partial [Aureobasidium melanogenum]